MTDGAECNQVARHISTKLAPRPYAMNLQILQSAAILTPPTIPFQHFFVNRGVFFRVKFDSRLLAIQAHRIHYDFDGRLSSSLAPARKSAQIISKQ
jgi:hypothetical protein